MLGNDKQRQAIKRDVVGPYGRLQRAAQQLDLPLTV
jgi:hypothetical protein